MSEQTGDREAIVEAIAAAFHERYEALAPGHGWESRTKGIPFAELPDANKQLMRETVAALIDDGMIEAGAGLSAGFQSVGERWGAIRAGH